MLRLIHPQRVPYGGLYELDDKAAGLVGKGFNLEALEKSIIKYREGNGLPIGLGLIEEIESAVCAKYPQECKECDPNVPPKPHALKLREVIVGSQVMVSLLVQGRPLVSEEEATRRAKICGDTPCPYNVTYTKPCGGICGALQKIVKGLIGDRPDPPTAKPLEACGICGCVLSAAIWVPMDIQVPPLQENVKNQFEAIPHCWKKPSLMRPA